MEQDREMQYAYEMIVNIVADMVVEYLKDNDTVATDANFEGKEGQAQRIEQEKTAA